MTLPALSDIYITTAIFLGALHAFEPGHGKSIPERTNDDPIMIGRVLPILT